MIMDGAKARAVYEREPGGDPRMWVWRGWAP
ncbi:hypothetical protein F4561_002740 [Lipingzhangella halophila]|uniref:Uncharacterized protein n=1 Tax=Lipingzhangella halophila TaxID=1783352 RepID=A0A7W7W3P2_9ACTN|nr:hypothetical protein [Lipingzhangella halophila]